MCLNSNGKHRIFVSKDSEPSPGRREGKGSQMKEGTKSFSKFKIYDFFKVLFSGTFESYADPSPSIGEIHSRKDMMSGIIKFDWEYEIIGAGRNGH